VLKINSNFNIKNKTPNILLITDSLSYGGGPKRLLLIKKILSRAGMITDLFTQVSNLDFLDESEVNGLYKLKKVYKYKLINQLYTIYNVIYLIKSRNYKTIVCNARNLFPVCKIIRLLFKVKYINLVQIRYKNAPCFFCYIYGDHVIAVSQGVSDYLTKEQKVDSSKIKIIKNSSPPIKMLSAHKQSEVRESLEIGSSFVISCIARFHPVKGQIYLIEAFKKLLEIGKNYNDIKLLLMGYGDYEKDIRLKINCLGLSDKVVFINPNHEVAEIFSITDLLVLPSLREGLPTAVLEGFSVGKTIVATDIPGNNEIVIDGYNGLLVPARNAEAMASAMGRLMSDNELRKTMEFNAMDTYKKEYSYDNYSESIINYFKSVADDHK